MLVHSGLHLLPHHAFTAHDTLQRAPSSLAYTKLFKEQEEEWGKPNTRRFLLTSSGVQQALCLFARTVVLH